MSESENEMWPTELEWKFIGPESPTPGSDDQGFYDAEFGPILLRVIITPDGRFRAAVADDNNVEIYDPNGNTHADLDDAKLAACAGASQILREGAKRVVQIALGLNPAAVMRQAGKIANFDRGLRERGMGPKDLLDKIDPVDIADCAVLQSILSLADRDVPVEVIEKWTPEERESARAWAAAAHLSASDNDDVVVPPIPAHVAIHQRVDLEML